VRTVVHIHLEESLYLWHTHREPSSLVCTHFDRRYEVVRFHVFSLRTTAPDTVTTAKRSLRWISARVSRKGKRIDVLSVELPLGLDDWTTWIPMRYDSGVLRQLFCRITEGLQSEIPDVALPQR
jgi:hypothetical protein